MAGGIIPPGDVPVGDGGGLAGAVVGSGTVVILDGVEYDADGRKGIKIRCEDADFAARPGYPTFRFRAYSRKATAGPFPWEGKTVKVKWDGTIVFSGHVERVEEVKSPTSKYEYIYHCVGLKKSADRVGVRDEQTGSDACTFNQRPEDQTFLPSRAGRTVGEIVLEVLEMPWHASQLSAAGIGRYVPGSGASYRATTAAGQVTGTTRIAYGSGYSTTSPPSVLFVGGQPEEAATGTATVSGGQVTGVSVTDQGSRYRYAPRIIISRLPAETVADLMKLDIIPIQPTTVQGERLLDAIDALIRKHYPNHFTWIDPEGTIRVWNEADFGRKGTEVTVSSTNGKGFLGYAIVDPITGGIQSVKVMHGGTGYATGATAAVTGDGKSASIGPVTVENGRVTAVGVSSPGTGYSPFRVLTLIQGYHSVTPPEIVRDTEPCASRVEICSAPLVVPTELSWKRSDITEKFAHDGLTSAVAKARWTYNDFESTTTQLGGASAIAELETGYVDTSWVQIDSKGSGGVAGTYNLSFSSSAGGSGATGTYTIGSDGKLSTITLTNGGDGKYVSTPSIWFSYGGLSGASAQVRLTTRPVKQLNLQGGGYDYNPSSPPTVWVGPPDVGTDNAAFTATVDATSKAVTGFTKTDGGDGYRNVPKVRIQGPYGASNVVYGTIVEFVDTTTVKVKADDPTLSWPQDSWSWITGGRQGIITLSAAVAQGINCTLTARVINDSGLPAGGEATLKIDARAPITTYTSFTLQGVAVGGSIVYRRYHVADETVGARLTNAPWAVPMPYRNSSGNGLQSIGSNVAYLLWSSTGNEPYNEIPATFTVDPDNGDIVFDRPTIAAFTNVADLYFTALASTWNPPTEMRILVGTYRDPLKVRSPKNDSKDNAVHAGTLYTETGIQRTLYLCHQDWREASQEAAVQKMADEVLDSVKDVVVEASFVTNMVLPCLFWPGTAINITSIPEPSTPTGLETIKLPVKRASLRWPREGAYTWTMQIQASNRRANLSTSVPLPPAREGFRLGYQDGHGPGT